MIRRAGLIMLLAVCTAPYAQFIYFDNSEADLWMTVNDTVMGGFSSSRFIQYDTNAVFAGMLSLDNNGGFASVRRTKPPEFANGDIIRIRVKGDGRKYQFRLKSSALYWGAAYVAEFQTIKDQWQEIEFVESDFTAKYRGREILNAPPLQFSDAIQVGFLIGDKKEGQFKLNIEFIQSLQHS